MDAMRQIAIVDPACGSGAFLIAAYELLEEEYETVVEHLARHHGKPASTWASAIPEMILTENLHGVDLSKEAVEITQTALWIRSARKGRRLDDLSANIVVGNSLVTDKTVHPDAMTWKETFLNIFKRPGGAGFDCVIGNPPWERLNLKNREFFALSAPEVLEASSAAEQRVIIAKLEKSQPELYREYVKALQRAERMITHVRESGRYPLTARGDINTYMVFAELARAIVRASGRLGLLVPSGIATDDTTKAFFGDLMQSQSLIAIYDFENRKKIFPDVDGRFKFSILLIGGADLKNPQADFVSFAHEIRDLSHRNRHVALSSKDLALLNPNTRTCPIFRSRRDLELTKAIYRRVPILIDEGRQSGGNPWEISYMLMFHQSFASEEFRIAEKLADEGYNLQGNRFVKLKHTYLPLYEAKMLQAYDHRAAGVEVDKMNWMRQGQTIATTPAEHQNPEFVVQPRWWIDEAVVSRVLDGHDERKIVAFKNVTSPTNQRTMIACFVPPAGVVHSAPVMLTGARISARRTCCLLANLNSFVYDYITRQKIGGINLSYYIINQIPTLSPDTYDDHCTWDKKQTLEKWISDRVLKLTCTANDMLPLAEAAGFEEGVHKWKDGERAELRAELDAAYFHLYGIDREDAEYVLSTFQGMTDGDEETFTPNSAASRILDAYDLLAST
ncbi:MAG TPA: DNA methyltransferase [Humisphaera sp.]|nr:DNA methyltransferase [Humisphaera sp.]